MRVDTNSCFFVIMRMDIIDRLQEIIKYEDLSVASFAKEISVPDQTIRGIVVQRRNKPGFEVLAKTLQRFTWLSAEWFILGQGEMLKGELSGKADQGPTCIELIQYLKEKDVKIERLIIEKTELKVKWEMRENQESNIKSRKGNEGHKGGSGNRESSSREDKGLRKEKRLTM